MRLVTNLGTWALALLTALILETGYVHSQQAAVIFGVNGGVPTAITTDANGNMNLKLVSGGAGGSTTQLQYNNAGSFGGTASLTWSSANSALTFGGTDVLNLNRGGGQGTYSLTIGPNPQSGLCFGFRVANGGIDGANGIHITPDGVTCSTGLGSNDQLLLMPSGFLVGSGSSNGFFFGNAQNGAITGGLKSPDSGTQGLNQLSSGSATISTGAMFVDHSDTAGGTGATAGIPTCAANVRGALYHDGAFGAVSYYQGCQLNGDTTYTYHTIPDALTNTAAYAAVTNTVTETFFGIGTDGKIPGGMINAAHHRLVIELAGVYGTNLAADTINLKFKLCTVSGCGSGTVVQIATTGAVNPAIGGLTNQGWNARVICNVLTSGAAGTIDCQGQPGATYFTALTAAVLDDIVNTATSTIDTTVAEFVSVSATWSAANAADTITLRNFSVTVY